MKAERRIIPSIYTSDSSTTQPSTQSVLSYSEALKLAIRYAEEGADEVIFMDVSPINDRRRNLSRFIKDTKSILKIPFVFGGGIHTVSDVEDHLKSGSPRIYVNSAAVKNPELINKISKKYGPETLLVAIDTRKTFGKWKVYLNGGKSRTEIDLLNWVRMSEVRGAGELLISTIARTNENNENIFGVLKEITQITNLPLITSVGASNEQDFVNAFSVDGISGVVSAHYFSKPGNKIYELKSFLDNAFQSKLS